jgi:hypothetical protein
MFITLELIPQARVVAGTVSFVARISMKKFHAATARRQLA